MAKTKKQDTGTKAIKIAGVTILVDADGTAERIANREWVLFDGESITTFTNGSELLGNFILGLPQGVFIEQVNKADRFNYTRRNLRPYVNRRATGRETRSR